MASRPETISRTTRRTSTGMAGGRRRPRSAATPSNSELDRRATAANTAPHTRLPPSGGLPPLSRRSRRRRRRHRRPWHTARHRRRPMFTCGSGPTRRPARPTPLTSTLNLQRSHCPFRPRTLPTNPTSRRRTTQPPVTATAGPALNTPRATRRQRPVMCTTDALLP